MLEEDVVVQVLVEEVEVTIEGESIVGVVLVITISVSSEVAVAEASSSVIIVGVGRSIIKGSFSNICPCLANAATEKDDTSFWMIRSR